MAGVEAARTELWGASIMIQLGLIILPSLRHTDVWVQDEMLGKLEREVLIIRANLDEIVAKTNFSDTTIDQRTQNILDAIQQARQVAGSIVIW